MKVPQGWPGGTCILRAAQKASQSIPSGPSQCCLRHLLMATGKCCPHVAGGAGTSRGTFSILPVLPPIPQAWARVPEMSLWGMQSVIWKIAFTVTSDELQLKIETKISTDNIYTLAPSSFKNRSENASPSPEPLLPGLRMSSCFSTRPVADHCTLQASPFTSDPLLVSSVSGSQTSFCCFWPKLQPFLPQGLWICCFLHLTYFLTSHLSVPPSATFPFQFLPIGQHLCISLSEKLFPTSQARLDSLWSYFIRMSQCRIILLISVSLSHAQLSSTPWTAVQPGLLFFTNSPEFTQTHVH